MKLDQTDKALLEMLQEDARTNVKELADRLKLTKTPIYERMKKYEQEGVIEKYVALIDRQKIGGSIVVFCFVELESQKLEKLDSFSKAVLQIPEVVNCYLMGGSSDFLLKVVVKDLEAYHKFSSGKLAALPNVSQIKSSFVLNEVKRSSVIPIY